MATINLCNFGLDRSRGLWEGRVLRQLITNKCVKVNKRICNSTNRSGYFCAGCKKDYRIAVYRYYGLPCAPCYDYGIALYLLLDVSFSTLFFVFIFAARINANSGKWIGFVFTAMLWLENWSTTCHLRLLFRGTLLLPCSCSQLMEYGTCIFSGK